MAQRDMSKLQCIDQRGPIIWNASSRMQLRRLGRGRRIASLDRTAEAASEGARMQLEPACSGPLHEPVAAHNTSLGTRPVSVFRPTHTNPPKGTSPTCWIREDGPKHAESDLGAWPGDQSENKSRSNARHSHNSNRDIQPWRSASISGPTKTSNLSTTPLGTDSADSKTF